MPQIRQLLFLIVVLVLGVLPILCRKSYAKNFFNRPVGNHNRGPGQNELIEKKFDSCDFDEHGNPIVLGGHVPTSTEVGKHVFLYFQWFPRVEGRKRWFDHIGSSISSGSGLNWTDPKGVNITKISDRVLGHHVHPMDPSAVTLPDGRIRHYFALEQRQPHNRVIGDANINSANSRDGIKFAYEPGSRFEINDVDLRDPAAVYFKSKWHLYAPDQKHQGTGYYATASDEQNYVRQKGESNSARGYRLGNATIANGKIYFFLSVWKANSLDGVDWDSDRSRGLGPDSAVIHLKDTSWLAVTFRPIRLKFN